jgi:hypothetical protein
METGRKSSAGGIVDNVWKQPNGFDSRRNPFCVRYLAKSAERKAIMGKIRLAGEISELKSFS